MKCYHCGKGVLFGRRHTHHRGVAGGRWKKRAPKTRRIFKPNIRRIKIVVAGKIVRVHLCVNCLKRVKKDIRDGKKPFLTLLAGRKKAEKVEKKIEVKKVVKEEKAKIEEKIKPVKKIEKVKKTIKKAFIKK